MDITPAARAIFRRTYGRLCTLEAQALTDGYHRHAVLLAAQGRSKAQDARMVELGAQHDVLHKVMRAFRGIGYETRDLIPDALDIKRIVESEWLVSLPLVSEGP